MSADTLETEFPGLKHYFVGQLCSSDVRVMFIRMAYGFLASDDPPFPLPNDMNNVTSLPIDYERFVKNGPVKHFGQQLLNDPENVINSLGVALYQALLVKHRSLQRHSLSVPFNDRKITARIINFQPEISLRDIKSNMISKFVSIRANVVRVGSLRPLVLSMEFECLKCSNRSRLEFPDGKLTMPSSCSTSKCRSKTFSAIRNSAQLVDWQRIRVQEILAADGQVDAGRVPRTLEVELSEDLVDMCIPGDTVSICGVVKATSMDEARGRGQKSKSLFVLYLHANSVRSYKSGDQSDEQSSTQFSIRDLYGISSIAHQQNLFPLLVWSLCPAIFGHEIIKAGLVLTLFGGSEHSHDGISLRSDPHMLIVGDPGLGKSQMLQAVCNIAPRGVYVCGNTASTSGLTVTVVRDALTGDFALEAGALVMGDQGICCIDEFDKMGQEHLALLEAMEQQSISVAKAGIVCSLSARTSVIAAANPTGGHYNPAKTVHENIKMSSAILSRFDLVFILLDTPDAEMDRLLSDHVMSLHSSSKQEHRETPGNRTVLESNGREAEHSIQQRLSNSISKLQCQPIPAYLLRKYIAYARKYVAPRVGSGAKRVLQEFYLKLRRQHGTIDSTPITTRQLESMIRLAEARARSELREEVTAADAQDVVDLMQESIFQTVVSESDGMVFASTSGMSQAKKVKKFVGVLQLASVQRGDCTYTVPEMAQLAQQHHISVPSFADFVDVLNTNGYILKKGRATYQFIVSDCSQA